MNKMPSNPFDEMILAADIETCAAFFETMSESQRKSHSARALQWASAINGYKCRNRKQYMILDKAMAKDITFYESIQAHAVVFPREFNESSFPAAQMSVLATCAFPELKKAGWLGVPEPHLASRILEARKPSWLSKWCSYILKEFPATHWSLPNSRNPAYAKSNAMQTTGCRCSVACRTLKACTRLFSLLTRRFGPRLLGHAC